MLSQAPAYGLDVAQGRSLLVRLKEAQSVAFISDTDDISRLPGWVKTPKQITDGHLCNLARQNGASFATLAESVPDSYLIPRSRSRMI